MKLTQPGCDFIFSIHAAQTKLQSVVNESLVISQNLPRNLYTDPVTHTRFLRLNAFPGPFELFVMKQQLISITTLHRRIKSMKWQ
jgi:hypothetical protein